MSIFFIIVDNCCAKLKLTTGSAKNQLAAGYKGVFGLQPDTYRGKALYKRNNNIFLYWTTKNGGYWAVTIIFKCNCLC